jgi:hypothetical protein
MMEHLPSIGEIPESPMIVAEDERDIVVAVRISKSTLYRHLKFLENLVDAGTRGEEEPQ